MNNNSRAEQFSRKMVDVLNYGALNLALAIGYEAGLFEVMSKLDCAAVHTEISDKAEVDERYLYEWLGVMVAGGIIEIQTDDSGRELFFLPREHVPFLCRSGGNSNLGVYTREIPLLTGCAKDAVLEGLRSGQGIPYSNYPRFYQFMEQLADAKHRQVLVDTFLPSVLDGEIVRRLERGIRVCDIGCGSGVALELMAEAYPRSSFVGIDFSRESILKAREEAEKKGLSNLIFQELDAAKGMCDIGMFDYITAFDSIHDQTDPLAALKNIYGMLNPAGVFSMIDIAAETGISGNAGHPMGPFLYTVSLMHCMPVGLIEGGAGLGMMWGRQKAVQMCSEAGFSRVQVEVIPEDGFNYHFLCIRD